MALIDILVNIPRPQKIASVIGLVIALAIGYFIVAPKGAERDELRQRNEALVVEVLKARTDESDLRRLRAQVDVLRKRLETARSRLPSEREIPALYREVSDLAIESGLALTLFASKPTEEKDGMVEIPVSVAAEGSYHQLASFFSRMSKIRRIVNLGDFRLAGIDRPTGTLRAELTLTTFLFRADGAAPPRTGGATKPAASASPPTSSTPGAGR